MSLRSKYADLNDIENPFKTYIISNLGFGLTPGIYHSKDIFIERNEVTLQDDWIFNLLESKPTHFNSVGQTTPNNIPFPLEDKIYGLISIRLSDKTNQFRRKIGNLFEVTGIIGGIFEVLQIAIGTLLGFLSHYIKNKDMMRDLKNAQQELLNLKEVINTIKEERKQEIEEEFEEKDEEEKSGGEEESNIEEKKFNRLSQSNPKLSDSSRYSGNNRVTRNYHQVSSQRNLSKALGYMQADLDHDIENSLQNEETLSRSFEDKNENKFIKGVFKENLE